jgi:hypothetical protein
MMHEPVPNRLQQAPALAVSNALNRASATPLGRGDVNRDGALSALDVLLVVNVMNGVEPTETGAYDINGDGAITPLDALSIVNDLNNVTSQRNQSPQLAARAALADGYFGDLDREEENSLFSLGFGPRLRG